MNFIRILIKILARFFLRVGSRSRFLSRAIAGSGQSQPGSTTLDEAVLILRFQMWSICKLNQGLLFIVLIFILFLDCEAASSNLDCPCCALTGG